MTSHPKVDSSRTSALWRYGLFAINSELLVESKVSVDADRLTVVDKEISLSEFDRIIVVGAGKAGTGMAKGLHKSLASLQNVKEISGWINVPANCVEELSSIVLHAGRPASLNEPTAQGLEGAQKILDLVRSAGPRDIVICLVSGGGSALAPLPVEGVSLENKQVLTRFLSKKGANINELNCVRSAISQIKGGGLVSDFAGHSFHTLIISDVLGNPLDVIASGMTVPRTRSEQLDNLVKASETLAKFDPEQLVDQAIYEKLQDLRELKTEKIDALPENVFTHVIGDNSTIVKAVEHMAKQLSYESFAHSSKVSEGDVGVLADNLWNAIQQRLDQGPLTRPFCFISGGEPTVNVSKANGKGGRNLHLALMLHDKLSRAPLSEQFGFEFVSLGTDGEDGPTDAAGAVVNSQVLENAALSKLKPKDYLESRDSYHFFEEVGGLIKTGPTHTNVCDLRIFLLWDKQNDPKHPF